VTGASTGTTSAAQANAHRRRLIVIEYVSLDGVTQTPGHAGEDTEGGFVYGGWTGPFMGAHGRYMREALNTMGALLLGRLTGNFFVIHPAYGRIGDVGVGGVEIIRFEHATGRYLAQFLDSQGNANTSDLISDGENWTWQGETTRCTGEFSADGRTLTAHHERRAENGSWVPSMEVVLTKVE
jgi:hypothetical protein